MDTFRSSSSFPKRVTAASKPMLQELEGVRGFPCSPPAGFVRPGFERSETVRLSGMKKGNGLCALVPFLCSIPNNLNVKELCFKR